MPDKNPAAVALGALGGRRNTEAQRAARSANARKGGRPAWRSGPLAPTLHRDGSVTYWSIYDQRWCHRAPAVPDEEYAAMAEQERIAVRRHILKWCSKT